MPNKNHRMYGLTTLCPIRNGGDGHPSYAALAREVLEQLPLHTASPFARVPNTYLCRLFVLDDVVFQGEPAHVDALQSKYLVYISDLHGELDVYLRELWNTIAEDVRRIWQYCVGFERVTDADTFVDYIHRCQVTTTFHFNGSSDAPLAEQLKALYLKQEFSRFAFSHQGLPPAELQQAFRSFWSRVQPTDLSGPTWRAGATDLEHVVVGEPN